MDIEIEFISSGMLKLKDSEEKLDFILDRIKEGKILVVEKSLTSREESKLIEQTMKEIDDRFSGIEISTLKEEQEKGIKNKLIKILGGGPQGLTVIGPSKIVKKIKREPQRISLFAGDTAKEEKKKKEKKKKE